MIIQLFSTAAKSDTSSRFVHDGSQHLAGINPEEQSPNRFTMGPANVLKLFV
ncbi:hypothetical protein SynBIOSE41_01065 [Synechococcus sp. BIOS-E4-1]|nr:hypothetical protein SynBIOSE41_01065 [Synechococcus sp. BIOS-E4-1]